jgi:hypothetical protein
MRRCTRDGYWFVGDTLGRNGCHTPHHASAAFSRHCTLGLAIAPQIASMPASRFARLTPRRAPHYHIRASTHAPQPTLLRHSHAAQPCGRSHRSRQIAFEHHPPVIGRNTHAEHERVLRRGFACA